MTEVANHVENGTNGHHHHNGHHRETEEERRVRKDRERKARENETEEERRIRKASILIVFRFRVFDIEPDLTCLLTSSLSSG